MTQSQPQATSSTDLVATLRRQTDVLVDHGYPELAGLSDAAFRELVTPLEREITHLPAISRANALAFVLVTTRALVPPEAAVPLIKVNAKQGWTDMSAAELATFVPIESVHLPEPTAYLLADIDTGRATLNVRPNDALAGIAAEARTPLTIDEGIAVLLQFPDIFTTHNAFQLLASRCGDKRVPTLWLSYRRPRLGWCWAGNPHTWLGAASATARLC